MISGLISFRAVASRRGLALFRLLRALFLHLLYRHVVLVPRDGLFAGRGQLGLPLAFARLGLFDAVRLVAVDVARSFGLVFVVCLSATWVSPSAMGARHVRKGIGKFRKLWRQMIRTMIGFTQGPAG